MLLRSIHRAGATHWKEQGRHANAQSRMLQQLCNDKGMMRGPWLCHPLRKVIDAIETVGAALVGHASPFYGGARVNVRAQIVARHTVKAFGGQNPFCWHLFRKTQPIGYRGLCDAHILGHCFLSASAGDAELKRFIPGKVYKHAY
jgi:hypothetical protein